MNATLEIDIPLRMGRGFKTDAERASLTLREALNLAPHDRLPARRLAKHLKINVTTPERITDIPPAALNELTISGKDRWSAALIKGPPTSNHLLVHNPTHSNERQESDIFHELSHHICKHEPDEIVWLGGFAVREYSKEKEEQAEFLGYALHITKDGLFWANKRGMTLDEIGGHFCASQTLVRHRINITGVRKILSHGRTTAANWN